MTNTIRNVTMDEIVFITSCHVSLNPNRGPATSQPAINMTAALNPNGWPLKSAKACANREYHEDFSTIVDPIGFSRDAGVPAPRSKRIYADEEDCELGNAGRKKRPTIAVDASEV